MLKRLAELADQLDKRGLTVEANLVDSLIKEAAEDEKAVKAPLTRKQATALRGFYKAAAKVVDVVSVGRKEFPDKDQRIAVASILSNLESTLDKLEKFKGDDGEAVIPTQLKDKR